MGEVSTIGLDIAKSVFQIHGVVRDGEVAIRKRVSRAKLLAHQSLQNESMELAVSQQRCLLSHCDLLIYSACNLASSAEALARNS